MAKRMKIKVGDIAAFAVLNDTNTANAIWEALPIEGRVNLWGEEIYFEIPVKCAPENPKAKVEAGELGYWPPGSAFCIFFGPTPMSKGDEIIPYSPVNVFGKIENDPKVFKAIRSRQKIVVERAEEG